MEKFLNRLNTIPKDRKISCVVVDYEGAEKFLKLKETKMIANELVNEGDYILATYNNIPIVFNKDLPIDIMWVEKYNKPDLKNTPIFIDKYVNINI